MERSKESGTDWQFVASDPQLDAMYRQKLKAAAPKDDGELKVKYSKTPPPLLQQLPETQSDEESPTRWNSTTIDAIEVIYEKLVQVKDKCRNSRTKMTEMGRKKDQQIEELNSKCASLEDELRSKTEELLMVDAGLQKIMKITDRVDKKITERAKYEFSGASEDKYSKLEELKEAFKKYETSTSHHIILLNTELRVRDTGLLQAISINQGLENGLLRVRNALTQQAIYNNQLQAEFHAIELKVKRLEGEAEASKGEKTPTITLQCFKEVRRDMEKQIKDLKQQHSEKIKTLEDDFRKRMEAMHKDREAAPEVRADTVALQQYRDLRRDQEQYRDDQWKAHCRNIKIIEVELIREKEKTQNQEKEIQQQKAVLSEQHNIIEQQQADLEMSIKALEKVPPGCLSPDYTPLEAEIEDLNDKLLERDLHIEELDAYIDTIENDQATDTKKVEEHTSQTVMDREMAEERAREWRKVPLDRRLNEARKSIIAEDCFLNCILIGKEE